MNRMLFFTAFAAGLFSAVAASAQGVKDCEGTLIRDIASRELAVDQRIAFLKSINRSNFDQVKTSLSNHTMMVVYGIPIDATTSYDKFEEHRAKFLSNYRFSQSTKIDDRWTTSYLSALSPQIYSRCIDGLNVVGAHIWAEKASPNSQVATIRFKFITAPGDQAVRTFSLLPSGGALELPEETANQKAGFRGSMSGIAHLTRDSLDQDARVSIAFGNSGDAGVATVTIPARAIVEKRSYREDTLRLRYRLKAKGKPGSQHSDSFCWTARDLAARTSRRDPVFIHPKAYKVRISNRRGGGGDEYSLSAKTTSPRELCVRGKLGIDTGLESHWADAEINAEYRFPVWTTVVGGP